MERRARRVGYVRERESIGKGRKKKMREGKGRRKKSGRNGRGGKCKRKGRREWREVQGSFGTI